MKPANNKILITGGATGIGLGLTERFIKENNSVIICGRRAANLNAASEQFPGLITRVCDINIPEERVALYNWVKEYHSDINVLVNNAGIQNWTGFDDPDFYQKAKNEITTNIEAPLHLTALFSQLPSLDTIMNVTSGLSFVPLTATPVYSATKAFFHSFTLSARHLLKARNIEVIEIIPPALNTDLGGVGLHAAAPPVSAFIESVFIQLSEGKSELTFGFSEGLSKADPDGLKTAFHRMNPVVK